MYFFNKLILKSEDTLAFTGYSSLRSLTNQLELLLWLMTYYSIYSKRFWYNKLLVASFQASIPLMWNKNGDNDFKKLCSAEFF